ncbi:glycosyltransferase family 4 protein [Fictibacillus enclensis]|uniref:glycosyltransferase family 4 protein n=1 Tax=Fictibacillus enclensis TaxID=1017270 RepID=UPI0025A23CAF|nr:glycosyltransferase family 4 protein [Fictibacillus enclensis]MDM5340539.1 glycosyltransferase family 4 protein [Fictibacillus enclensis]
MKNVLIVGPLPPPIHGESVAINTIVRSKKIQFECNLISVNTNRKNTNRAGKFSVRKILSDIYIINKILFYVIFKHIDVLYLSISQTKLGLLRDLVILGISTNFSKKSIVHLHGNNLGTVLDDLSRTEFFWAKKILKKVDVGIVLCQSLSNNYRNLIKEVRIISNGVDSNYIRIEDLQGKKSKENINILYLSNLIKEKGYIELIKAIIDLLKEGYKINLHLAGAIYNKEEFDGIFHIIRANGLDNHIKYCGIVNGSKKKELLLSSDIMVLPSNYPIEGQPISIIEGMAAGLAIIATNRGGIPELIDSKLLIQKGEREFIKTSLKELLLEGSSLIRVGNRNREKFLNNYTTEIYEENILKVFKEDTF